MGVSGAPHFIYCCATLKDF